MLSSLKQTKWTPFPTRQKLKYPDKTERPVIYKGEKEENGKWWVNNFVRREKEKRKRKETQSCLRINCEQKNLTWTTEFGTEDEI